MSDGEIRSLTIGEMTFVPCLLADGVPFLFNPSQIQFLTAHQKTRSVEMAAKMIGRDKEWADQFLSSKKFKRFVSSKMNEASARNGITVEWWYQFGKDSARGYTEYYQYHCKACDFAGKYNVYDVEKMRDDDLKVNAECFSCYGKIDVDYVKEEFQPSREQMEAWKALGDRIIPKIERVHHEFSREEMVFQTEEE